jgi:hypothetical protein
LEETNARKVTFDSAEALALARKSRRLVSVRGKKSVEIEVSRKTPEDRDLIPLLLGPSGNLRAPSIRVGKLLVVGFQEGAWARLLG